MDLSAMLNALLNKDTVKTAAMNAAQSGANMSPEQKQKVLSAAASLGIKDTAVLEKLLSDPEKMRALLLAIGKGKV